MFKPVNPKIEFAALEEDILEFWKKKKIFEKSITARPESKKWNFLDGPPFVTGMPHYGSLLSSLPKDVFGRYWTMKGYRVRRVWGWDGHGLPIENKVENELEIERKRDIEEVVGVKKFVDECKHYVNVISSEWEWYVDHIGRWVDFQNAYKTWDTPYMESVMWVFKQMYDKGYVYKGFKVSLYCPHCVTPISNFEVAMDAENYKEVEEDATTYKYKVSDEENTYFLAWSTTPWTKIATTALAVNPKLDYVKVKVGDESYILATTTLSVLADREYKVVEELKGKDLVGMKYEPHYDYYKDNVKKDQKVFEVISGDFVSADEGTGIVTIAAYGEEDLKVMGEQNVYIEMHLTEEGMVKEHVPQFGGMYYLKANKFVDEDLEKRGLILKINKLSHRVPLCWRCHTRLYYAPIDAWYVNVQILKDKMKKSNEDVHWYPKHFKHGRFQKSLENAPDWNISRNRYWGSPVPVWECECGERFVPGSIAELEKASGKKVTELHKPEIDEVTVTCQKCGKEVHRVSEVLDSWIEAGSASFGERHYPFGEEKDLKDFYPPDFIGEYTGQIRAWFYVLHVIANALDLQEGKNYLAKNVLVEGVILGTDGRKMSKNFKNYPDPKEMLQKYGGDALRLYLLGSPVMNGEDILISEEQYRHQVRGTMLILWNVYNFFVTYSLIDKWEPSKDVSESKNVLDVWILSLLNKLTKDVTTSLDNYNTVEAIEKIKQFVADLSTWHIRRSRDRVGPSADDQVDKEAFYATIHTVLVTLSKLLAPIAPFLSEAIYTNLTSEESVHLADWPSFDESKINLKLEEEMLAAREVASQILMRRKMASVKVRMPLHTLTYAGPKELSSEVLKVVAQEVNVHELVYAGKKDLYESTGDATELTDIKNQDTVLGQARELVRKIQEERKKLETNLDELVNVSLEDFPSEHVEYIRRNALVKELSKGTFEVRRISE